MLGLPTDFNVRVQTWLTTFVAMQLTSLLSFTLAWGIGDFALSAIVTFLASIVASLGASIFIITLVRVRKLVDYLAHLAEEQANNESGIKGVVTTEKMAATFDSPKVVGQSGADSL